MKILVLGSKGQLGKCLKDKLENLDFEYEVIYTTREQIDISNFERTKKQIREASPHVIINAAAFTAVDKAEEDEENANLINYLAVQNIAEICNQQDCWLIHISTDYVFDGNSNIPYKEDYQTNPKSVYGKTKLKGELAIQSSGCKHIIMRTAWVFSEYGDNFLKTMLRLGAERDELGVISDQMGCPTYAQDIAASIIDILPHLYREKTIQGIYHYCGDKPSTWYDFAQVIFTEAKLLGNKTPQLVKPINTIDYPTLAARPAYSVLDSSKIKSYFEINDSDWRLGVKMAVNKLI